MGQELAARKTPLTADEVKAGLEAAWQSAFQVAPDPKSIAVLMAQSALETGRWRACITYNLGGAKAVFGGPHDWTFFTTTEVLPTAVAERLVEQSTQAAPCSMLGPVGEHSRRVIVRPRHPLCCFRAFRTSAEGCEAYMGILRNHFAKAWPAVEAGDIVTFVAMLKTQGYFTAPESEYLHGVEGLFWEFLGRSKGGKTP